MTAVGDPGCPSCGGTSLGEIVHWPSVPVNAALFPATEAESLAIPRASLRLVACETCGLVFNADHDGALVEYSPRCVETQACSPTSLEFTDALARDWVARHALRGRDVVEIGCGPEASFLRTMCKLTGGSGIGVDPACRPGSDGVVTLIAERLAPVHAALPGAALICRHTLEHVADVRVFVGLLRRWAAGHPGAPVLIEVPDAERILREGSFWDIYYEHCSYFTAASLDEVLRRAGLGVVRARYGFGGQYLLAEALPVEPQETASRAAPTVAAARAFGELAAMRIDAAHEGLTRLRADGSVVLWQAGGKALAVLTLADVDDAVAGVVDANPAKRGLYLPGTSHEILGPEDVPALAPHHVVVMNPIYVEEVRRSLGDVGLWPAVVAFEDLLGS